MSTNPPFGPGTGPGLGHRFEEIIDLIELELRHAIGYVNDSVVPHVRRESITAMRRVSDTLRNLADRFEASGNRQNPPPGQDRNPAQNPPQNASGSSSRDPRA